MVQYLRHFAYKHPLFAKSETKTGVPYMRSIYYLWWEFLRRNDGYKLARTKRSRGSYQRLYEDFGDVHVTDFRTWWTKGDRGARLFAEPPIPMSVTTLKSSDLDSVKLNWNDDSTLVVAIPLTLPRRFIERKVKAILDGRHKGRRGKRANKASRALYPLTAQVDFKSLKLALDVYDYRLQHPEVALWEIAQNLGFSASLKPAEIGKRGKQSPEAVEKKNTMSVAVSRKIRQAKAIIDNVGNGLFPGPM